VCYNIRVITIIKKGDLIMNDLIKTLITFSILFSFSIIWFLLANEVNAWEIANNYPYGKLCDVFNNCK
jgi:hypothetical protein